MKAGRNDPCPCGSGKKYKKCCIAKDQEAPSPPTALIPAAPSPVALSHLIQRPKPAEPTAPAQVAEVPTPPVPIDPVTERGDSLWREFESQNGEGRIAVFYKTLEDAEVMTDGVAFEMVGVLHGDAVKNGSRTRFAECVNALRERRPDVFDEGRHYYLSWCLDDALAESRQEVVPSLARELAGCAGRDIDTFNHASAKLGYHGQLPVLVEILRIAWPFVKSSDKIVPWGITEFAENGVNHEIFDYLEHTTTPDAADAALLDRIHFFIEDPRENYLREFDQRPDRNLRAGVACEGLRPATATEKKPRRLG